MSADGGTRLAAAVCDELVDYAARGRRESKALADVLHACPTVATIARAGGFDSPLRGSCPWSGEERRALRSMAEGGMADEEIALVLLRTPHAVRTARTEQGIHKARRKK